MILLMLLLPLLFLNLFRTPSIPPVAVVDSLPSKMDLGSGSTDTPTKDKRTERTGDPTKSSHDILVKDFKERMEHFKEHVVEDFEEHVVEDFKKDDVEGFQKNMEHFAEHVVEDFKYKMEEFKQCCLKEEAKSEKKVDKNDAVGEEK